MNDAGTTSAYRGDECRKYECQKFDESQGAGIDVCYCCANCRDCPDSQASRQDEEISVREEVEQDVIIKCVQVDLTECETEADLPRLKDAVGRLSSNKGIAL